MANKLPQIQAARAFQKPGPTYVPGGGTTVGGCPTPSGPYINPGTQGACAPRGSGYGWFGIHEATFNTTENATTVSPQRPVTIRQLIANTPVMQAATITSLKVNTDLLLHGSAAPLSIFAADAATPVPFDLTLSTADTVTVATQGGFVPSASDQAQGGGLYNAQVELGGVNCYNSRYGLDYACAPLGKGNRSIVLGMGTTSIAAADIASLEEKTASQSPSTPIRLGRLVIDAWFSAATGATVAYTGDGPALMGSAVAVKPIWGGQGASALDWLKVTSVSINDVNLLTNVPTNGGIPASSFSAQSVGHHFPDVVCSQADTIKVTVKSYAPGAGDVAGEPTSATNAMKFTCAWVGCEVLGSC